MLGWQHGTISNASDYSVFWGQGFTFDTLCLQQLLNLLFETGKFIGNHVPNNFKVHAKVFMGKDIS